ncbi:MAG: c-type cytochrome [Armatimonadetes bacterium]|nr:c-type cytochrome [Armatimonadota bacterium]
MFFLRSMVSKLVFWSIILLLLVLYIGIPKFSDAIWNNEFAGSQHDFTYWQGRYKDIAAQLATNEEVRQAALNAPIEVKQVTATQFPLLMSDGSQQQRVDRCQSCHIGLENPQMTAENIIRVVDGVALTADQVAGYLDDPKHAQTRAVVKTIGAHPGIDIENGAQSQDLGVVHSRQLSYGVATQASPKPADQQKYAQDKTNLKLHPFPTFGCTTCHYGQGRDLVQDKAHGSPEHSLTPLLPVKYMEAACAQCHSTYNSGQDSQGFTISYLPQMTTIARGEQLFKQQACYGCHKIEGFSKGNIGPELTYEGRVAGTYLTIEHQIWDPRYKVNGCVMPYFFSAHAHNTDDPRLQDEPVDPRADLKGGKTATLDGPGEEDIQKTLDDHGYVALGSEQDKVDALVTFVTSQTGLNYAASPAQRFSNIAAYNLSNPPDVPVTVAEGKALFEQSGCYACHYIGDPNVKHVTGDPQYGKGGIFGPELSWEGSRHSQEWMIAHYQNPQEFVPGSIMPIFPLSNTQRAALSLFDGSHLPATGRRVSADQDMPSAAQQQAGAQVPNVRYALPLGQGQR